MSQTAWLMVPLIVTIVNSVNKAKKLTKDLNTHSIQYATKIIKTKRKLGFHQHNANGTGRVPSRNPPDPH